MKHWKRICCGILVLILVVSCLPASVFALELDENTYTAVFHYQMDEAGNYTDVFTMYGDEFNPKHYGGGTNYLGNTANLWVYTKSMLEEEQAPGSCVPYLTDEFGNKWKLSHISLANHDFIEGVEVVVSDAPASCELMNEEQIKAATNENNYIIPTTDLNIAPGTLGGMKAYAIIYGWKLVDEGETPTQYTVSYDANLPDDVNKLFPVVYTRDTDDKMLDIDEGNGINQVWLGQIVGEPTQEYAGQPYTVSDYKNNQNVRNYCDFLVFDTETKTYYDFVGWRVGENVYQIGETIDNLSALDDGTGNIEFSGVWEKIEPLDNSKLYPKLKLDVFHFDNAKTDEGVLLTQQTNTDENLSTGGKYTSQPVTLDENGIISYRLAGKVSSSLTSTTTTSSGAYITYSKDFCSYTITLNVDGKLEFANPNADGTVSISFTCPYLEPQELNVDGTTIAKSTEPDTPDTYTITFNPENALRDTKTGAMQLAIKTQWIGKNYGGKAPLLEPFVIEGLDFKLKDEVSDPASFEIHTSANIVGSMDQAKMSTGGQIRYYYSNVLSQYRQNKEWQEAFGADYMDPTNYAHAVQFFDYKLANYDLSTDTSAYVKANTVTATYPGTVTVTPANITIYMGGDGGYDAVVDDSDTTSSNSLPHPLFKVEVPDGIDPEELVFANGENTWKLVSDGNGYFHFSEDGDAKVRVTYSYTDENNVEHTITDDAFDPRDVDEMYTTFTIKLYAGDGDTSNVTVSDENGMHRLEVGTGTLTVRAVAENNAVSPVQNTAPTKPVDAGSGVLVAASDTKYTLNNLGVPLPETAKPSLLFDGIIDDATHNRTAALVDAIEEAFDINVRDGYFQAQYLDLVDANNGNAWIKASDDVTVYWGYPEGTDRNTKFTLYHFTGLHRDGTNSGFDMEDISKSKIEVVDEIEMTKNGIAFDVEPGGFSPFVLVWEKRSPIIPTFPEIPEDTPDLLELDDHDAYIQGYPDGHIKPQNNITRAEVATIFYRLLTDDARAYYKSTDSGFSDVKPGDWYNTAVSTMVQAGILNGYSDGTFKPNASITRGEFATIAARFLSNPYSTKDRFYDTEGHWAEVYINRAAEEGWINGYSDGTFKPDQAITRAEAVTLVNNVLGRKPHADHMLPEMVTWPDNPKSAWYYEAIQEATNSHDYRWSSSKSYEIWTELLENRD